MFTTQIGIKDRRTLMSPISLDEVRLAQACSELYKVLRGGCKMLNQLSSIEYSNVA